MSYKLDSIVGKQEADALKELIFKRVRERSKSMNEDVQDDVMDLARESFVSKDNPFSKIIEKAEQANSEIKDKTAEKREEIGFPLRELKSHAIEQKRILNEQAVIAAVHNNMEEAHKTLNSRKSFMGALDFLNSQAAVSLMRTRSDRFEVVT